MNAQEKKTVFLLIVYILASLSFSAWFLSKFGKYFAEYLGPVY